MQSQLEGGVAGIPHPRRKLFNIKLEYRQSAFDCE